MTFRQFLPCRRLSTVRGLLLDCAGKIFPTFSPCWSHAQLSTSSPLLGRGRNSREVLLDPPSPPMQGGDSCSNGEPRKKTADNSSEASERTVGLTQKDQRKLLRQRPSPSPDHRLLKVAIVGAPNAGKSTLLNKLVGWKVAPVSQKVHTTRHKTLAVLTEDDRQVVFLDTPGIIVPGRVRRHNLELSLLVDPHASLTEADLVIVLVDVSHVWHRSRLDPELLKLLHLHADMASILVLNKVDLVEPKHRLLNVVRNLTCGIVGDRRDWQTVKTQRKSVNLEALFARARAEDGSNHGDEPSEKPETFDIRETCTRLLDHDAVIGDDDDVADKNSEAGISQSSYGISQGDVSRLVSDTRISVVEEITAAESDLTAVTCNEKSDRVTGKPKIRNSNGKNDDDDNVYDNNVGDDYDGEVREREFGADRSSVDDLYSPDGWKNYYRRLTKIGRRIENVAGWPHFNSIFMVSALDGDGVADLRNYLLDRAYQSPWLYSASLVTDQNPIKLATMIIRERLLDHLPAEIPYCLHVKLSLWEISDDGLLRAAFDIICDDPRYMRYVLGKDGKTIQQISAEAKQELMNAFRREMTLKLDVHSTGAGRNMSRVMSSNARSKKSNKSETNAANSAGI